MVGSMDIPAVQGSRIRVITGFVALGLFWGSWGALLPAIKARAGADEGSSASRCSWWGSARW
jgi:hypothetical protein